MLPDITASPPCSYSRDDCLRYIADDDWSELETTELIHLCDKLRFVVIYDRFNRAGVSAKVSDPGVAQLPARRTCLWDSLHSHSRPITKIPRVRDYFSGSEVHTVVPDHYHCHRLGP